MYPKCIQDVAKILTKYQLFKDMSGSKVGFCISLHFKGVEVVLIFCQDDLPQMIVSALKWRLRGGKCTKELFSD